MINKSFVVLLLFLSKSGFLWCNTSVDIFSDNNEVLKISKSLEILTDTTGTLSFQEIITNNDFKQYNKTVPNLGVTPYAHWIRFRIKNQSDFETFFLEIDNAIIDSLDFYTLLPEGGFKVERTGESYSINSRKFKNQNFIFKVNLPKGEEREYYLRVRSGDIIILPISFSSSQVFFDVHWERELILGIYVGIILVMFFYNLFIFFTVCDANYLYYVFYILSVGFTQVTLLGYTYKYLWPDFPRFANQSLILFAAFAGISIVLFLRKFLQVKKYAPLLNKGLNIIFIGYAIAVALRLFADHNIIYNNISYNLADILAGIIGFYSLIIAIIISLKGYRPAKFFLLAWSIFLIGMFIYVLRNFGFLPYNNFTTYLMPFGNAAEVILLSFALADRINVLKKEKEISQAEALKAFEENERIIKEQNVMLENKVKERTEDLTKTNEELAKALKELKEAQSQLVQSEKMASLGQLTAGIAHEINNPINFVNTSIRPLRRDINDILSVLKEYDNLSKENFKERIQEISSLKNSIDLPYLKKEIESLLQGIEEGATRTAEIVKGLRTFSRIDETDLKRVDIHEGIDSTLILLASMMHGKIVIEKNYGSLPLVECYAGKMNQVFMNILNNAIHAILKKNMKDEEGKIIIKTSEFRNDVVISIKDNGIGMSEEVRKKIFDPFFTTKDVGEGTGLGLSIVYKIIENHKGKIEVHSEEGLGTAFTLTLPKLYSES